MDKKTARTLLEEYIAQRLLAYGDVTFPEYDDVVCRTFTDNSELQPWTWRQLIDIVYGTESGEGIITENLV